VSEETVQNAEGREVPGEVTASSRQEELASNHGWVPLEEWEEQGKDPEDWVDAKVFNMRGEFFDKISRQNREVNELRKTLQDLKNHQQQLLKAEREKVLKDLREAKKDAINRGDGDEVIELEDRIDVLKSTPLPEPDQEDMQRLQQEAQQKLDQWVSENRWYAEDPDLRTYADFVGKQLMEDGVDPETIWTEVPKRVKAAFADKFSNPRRQESTVASTNNVGTSRKSKKGPSWNDLDDMQKQVAIRFEKSGTMTREEYIKDLADSGLL